MVETTAESGADHQVPSHNRLRSDATALELWARDPEKRNGHGTPRSLEDIASGMRWAADRLDEQHALLLDVRQILVNFDDGEGVYGDDVAAFLARTVELIGAKESDDANAQ